jgi:glycyl-tRNA synthetase beta chain
LGLVVKPDPGLLDEVTGLAEFPVVLAGAIDADFMNLPPEVLQTAMRAHQKYFSCVTRDGRPAPNFLFVANNLAEDGGAAIVAGNERVLRARLADARFFWDQDRKVRLEDRVDALKDRVYHARLGTVYDKVKRVERLAVFLAKNTRFPDDFLVIDAGQLRRLAERAAHLAKADLSTGMVGELPELQGVMGRYYALQDGEDPQVADALADHYRPLGPNDVCPASPVGMVVALADKIDTLAAFFAIGEKPTGSRDPYALRRAAQGIIRIILENRLRISLGGAFAQAQTGPGLPTIADPGEIQDAGAELRPFVITRDELLAFIADRLKVHLRDRGVRHDLVSAAFAPLGMGGIIYTGRYEDDLVRLLARVQALAAFLASEDGANLLIAYRRASNIVAIEDRKDGYIRNIDVDRSLLRQFEETALAAALDRTEERAGHRFREERFEEGMAELARLRQPVDDFFDKVTVNTDDAKRRENRLRLLARIRAVMNQVADFSQIEG